MIIDYKNNKDFALANGVHVDTWRDQVHFSHGKVVTDTTFCNFDQLSVENTIFENCTFENCQKLSFETCQIKNCNFKNISLVDSARTNFYDCIFKDCSSDGPFLSIDSHGQVKGCTFDTITARGDQGYIIWSGYGKKHEIEMIVNCNFIDCKIESEDEELCHCYYFKPLSSINTVEVDNLDYETCHFNNCTTINGEPI